MGDKEITIICYAKTEDGFQRLLKIFNATGEKYKMLTSAEKTKCITTSKKPSGSN